MVHYNMTLASSEDIQVAYEHSCVCVLFTFQIIPAQGPFILCMCMCDRQKGFVCVIGRGVVCVHVCMIGRGVVFVCVCV